MPWINSTHQSGKFISTHQSLQTNLSGTQTPPSHSAFSSLTDIGHLLPPSQSRPQKHGSSLMLQCQKPEGQNIHVFRGETESNYRRKVNERTAHWLNIRRNEKKERKGMSEKE